MLDLLPILSTIGLGLYAGSLLTEAVILVPYWRRMNPDDFFRLHGTLGPNLFRYFAPLTAIAVFLAVAASAVDNMQNSAWLLSAGLSLVALLIFFVYFKTANKNIAAHAILDQDLAGELKKWANWHWLRTVLIIIALCASVYGHSNMIA